MTGGSYSTYCDDCGSDIRASARHCPNCGAKQPWVSDSHTGADKILTEVFRRETITESADGGLQVGERETVDVIDDVCSTLEGLRDDVDNPDVRAALRSATSHAWRASILQRIDENSDIRMLTDTDNDTTPVRGPVSIAYIRERGGDDRAQLTTTGRIVFAAICLLTLGVAFAVATGVIVP